MTGAQRREQLIGIGRSTFAERGLEGTSVEEIAHRAGVSKPVIYEHFGGKEGLYNAVVEEEMGRLNETITESISLGRSRVRIERAVLALLTYVEEHTDGFVILVRDSGGIGAAGAHAPHGYSTLLNDATDKVSHILGAAFTRNGLNESIAPVYSQALVGMVSQTAQWWLDVRHPDKETVAAHIVNLCWNGLAGMETDPQLHEDVEGPAAERGVVLGAGADADPAEAVRSGRTP